MQIEPSTAIAIVILTTGFSLGCVVLFLVVAALGFFGVPRQLLAASWLIGATLVVTNIFLETPKADSSASPNVEVSGSAKRSPP